MPSTIGNFELFTIKHTILLEGETFLRNKHKTAFFEIKCTFFGRKENTVNHENCAYSCMQCTCTIVHERAVYCTMHLREYSFCCRTIHISNALSAKKNFFGVYNNCIYVCIQSHLTFINIIFSFLLSPSIYLGPRRGNV